MAGLWPAGALIAEYAFRRRPSQLFAYMTFSLPPGRAVSVLATIRSPAGNDLRPAGHRRYNVVLYRLRTSPTRLPPACCRMRAGVTHGHLDPAPAEFRRAAMCGHAPDLPSAWLSRNSRHRAVIGRGRSLQADLRYDLESSRTLRSGRVADLGEQRLSFVRVPHVAAGVSKARDDAAGSPRRLPARRRRGPRCGFDRWRFARHTGRNQIERASISAPICRRTADARRNAGALRASGISRGCHGGNRGPGLPADPYRRPASCMHNP